MTTTILDRATRLYDLGLLPVLGHMSIDPDTGKKTLKFTKGWNDMSSNLDYFIAATEAYDLHPDYYNVIALHCNPKLSSIRIIDLDIIKENREESISEINELMELAKANGNPIDQTPNGGYHIFYKSEQPLFGHMPQRNNKLPTMGIDLLERSMLCIVDGLGYKKVNYMELDSNTMPSLSDEFITNINNILLEYKTLASDTQSVTTTITAATSIMDEDIGLVRDLVDSIDMYTAPKIEEYSSFNDYWLYHKIIAAIYNSTMTDRDEGLKIAREFSRKYAIIHHKSIEKSVSETEGKWRHGWYGTDIHKIIKIGTLYKLAGRKGPLHHMVNPHDYEKYIEGKDVDGWISYTGYYKKWYQVVIDRNQDQFYEFMYDTQRAVKRIDDISLYVRKYTDGTFNYGPPDMFEVLIAMGSKCRSYNFKKGKDDIYAKFGTYLKMYERKVFYPGNTNNLYLNTWTGFKATILSNGEYDEELIQPFIYHIRAVICGGNEAHANWMMCWLANIIQYPYAKNTVALILYSYETGTGKSILSKFFKDMIIGSTHAAVCSGLDPLFETHNTIFENKIFINVEEAATNKKDYAKFHDLIKDIVTNDVISINPKGLPRYEANNYCKLCITTNHINAVPISDSDRRFTMFEVSNKHQGDYAYMDKLLKCFTDQTFADHVFTYLSKYNIDVNLRIPLDTDIRAKSIDLSGDSLNQFIGEIVYHDHIYEYAQPNGYIDTLNFKESRISSTKFMEAYMHYCKQNAIPTKHMKSLRKIRINGRLPHGLCMTRMRGCTTDVFYFKDLTTTSQHS